MLPLVALEGTHEDNMLIIGEYFLPNNKKSILPLQHKGIGGDKYIVNDIYFKFSVDKRDRPLFGGNNEYAAKIAANELKSLAQIVRLWTPGLFFPMVLDLIL